MIQMKSQAMTEVLRKRKYLDLKAEAYHLDDRLLLKVNII